MKETGGVHRGQRATEVYAGRGGLARAERAASLEDLFERLAAEQLHPQANAPLVHVDAVNGDHIVMTDAREHRIPIFMVRLGYGKRLGEVAYDALWKPAVERSGGRFYAAADEGDILRAVSDIDRLSAGTIAERRYASAAPAFAGYALIAVVLWLTAGTLKLAFPYFRTFP